MVTRREIWASILFLVLLMGSLLAVVGTARALLGIPVSSPYIVFFLSLFEVSLLLPPWLVIVIRRRGRWTDLGFRPFHPLFLGLAGGFLSLSFLINLLWSLLLTPLGLEVQPEILPLFGEGLRGLVLALITAGLIAPLAEETFFRGFLFAVLRGYQGPLRAMITTALLFTLFHLTPTAFVPLFFLGCFLALLYHLSGSLWPGILLHATMNSLAIVISYLAPRPL